jgi:hypothetical protein
MNDDHPMDLSALDPARDPERWAQVVAATRVRIEAALDRLAAPPAPLDLLAAWFRPILAAAAIAVGILGGARLMIGDRTAGLKGAPEFRRLAVLSSESIGRGQRPTGSQLLVALRSRSAP